MNSTILLFTTKYPYGTGENFIENEMEYLSNSFKTIYILPLNIDDGPKRKTPLNAIIIDIASYEKIDKLKDLKWLYKINKLWLIYLFKSDLSNFRHTTIQSLINIKWIVIRAQILSEFIKKENLKDCIFYSYWFSSWAIILSLLKDKSIINSYISRAHGFDLYEERYENNSIPYQLYKLDKVRSVFTVSKNGEYYLKHKYPTFNNKIENSYLGTKDYGINSNFSGSEIHVVSISNLIDLKRVHLIFEILQSISINVIWTHIGDGPLIETFKSKINTLPENIKAEFIGQLNNFEVISFLQKTYITFLLNVSEFEGLPVSIMESISFGIPIIATNVGGTKEIVKDVTGVLIPSEFNPNDIGELIIENRVKFNDTEFRKGVRDYWKEHFNAKTNYNNFIKNIII